VVEALGDLALMQPVRRGGSGLDIVEKKHRVMAVLECAWNGGPGLGVLENDDNIKIVAVPTVSPSWRHRPSNIDRDMPNADGASLIFSQGSPFCRHEAAHWG